MVIVNNNSIIWYLYYDTSDNNIWHIYSYIPFGIYSDILF